MIKPEEWKLIFQELDNIFGYVNLQCDEYKLTIKYGRGKKPTDVSICIYVNDMFKGKWFGHLNEETEPEEAKRFFPIKSRYAYTSRSRKHFDKLSEKLKKWHIEKYFDPYEKISYRGITWRSLNSLKKHLIANNKEISILCIGSKDYANEEQS